MKNTRVFPCLILIITALFAACRGPEAKEKGNFAAAMAVPSQSKDGEKYALDKKESVVTWKGSMALGSGGHIGYVYVSKGDLIIEKDQLVGGTIEIDMNTIADKDHGSENNLVWHLKDPDFFDVEKFPFSIFAITAVTPMGGDSVSVSGIMTIKGITNPITFPAKVEIKDGVVNASGNANIDRTKWEINYRSGKFFTNLANEAISDTIELQIKIVARK